MIKIGIAGATGYVGVELTRLLHAHPHACISYLGTQSHAGQPLKKVYPHLWQSDLVCEPIDAEAMAEKCDVIFTALPHGNSVNLAEAALQSGKKLIDLGADFRLKSRQAYEQWYQHPAPSDALLGRAVYGCPEMGDRSGIMSAQLVANPGCYPTGSILAALPALQNGLVESQGIVIDAKSGTSGAGKSPTPQSHFCEVAENFKAYNIAGSHRHTPEIEQAYGQLAGKQVFVQFTPHLLPIVRGLLITAYFQLQPGISQMDAYKTYASFYEKEPFVRICPLGELPQTANVRGTNICEIGLQVDARTGRLIVVSVIDNLIKGAAGQAIQNMNIMCGLAEITGLSSLSTAYP